ncbi:hypothetical protein [Iocasia frigidifontis]|uniref:hypothetical protein n=1 Tax=Iocasia fonsfrigidae TaxID=2682810 RepID=UPI001E590AA6|nr:hypothetical protein [Iocasia fonsfrigidae]
MRCPECYSEESRATPLRGAEDCLRNHRQYICSVCGRHVCIDLKGKRRARCFFPFSSLEDALLYLKCAEIISGSSCNIYEITDKKSGRKSFKIYPDLGELKDYLKKNKQKYCDTMEPVFISKGHQPVEEGQIKYLSGEEIESYLEEMKSI